MNDTYIPDFEEIVIPIKTEEIPVVKNEEVEEVDKTDVPTEEVPEAEEIKYSENADPKAIAFFSELKERNYLIEREDKPFDGTWETIDSYIEELPQAVLNSVVENLPDISKPVLQFIAEAGDNITKDELKTFFKSYFEDLEEQPVSVETVDAAREYLESVYKSQGIKPNLINVMLDKLEDDDLILDEAKAEMEKQSAKTRKVDELITNKSQENVQIKEQQVKFIQDVSTELKNFGWKPERVDKVQNVLKGQEFNNALKEIVSNPRALVQLADFITYYDKKNKTFDLDVFQKQFETKQTISLKEKLERNQFSSNSTSSTVSLPNNNKKYEKIEPVFD